MALLQTAPRTPLPLMTPQFGEEHSIDLRPCMKIYREQDPQDTGIVRKRRLHARAERRRSQRKEQEISRMRLEVQCLEHHFDDLRRQLDIQENENNQFQGKRKLRDAYLNALILAGHLRREKLHLLAHSHNLSVVAASIECLLEEYCATTVPDDMGFLLYQEQQLVEQLHSARCTKMMRAVYAELRQFRVQGTPVCGGSAAAMGWIGNLALQGTEVNYNLSKVFYGLDIENAMERTWLAGHDPSLCQKLYNATSQLEIIEKVTPDIFILRRIVQTYPDNKKYRCVNFAFRLKTEKGYVLCVRSLREPSRSVQDGNEENQFNVMDQFYWIEFAATEDGGCEVTSAGRLNNGTLAYARNRLVEIPIAMMWWETEFAQPMFSFTSNDEYA